MHYIGVDLAWGQRQPTGVAVLDAEGACWRSARHGPTRSGPPRAPYAAGECLVTLDARSSCATDRQPARGGRAQQGLRPLRRRCTLEHGQGGFPRPARAPTIAAGLGLDVNRARGGRGERRGLPAPATVALFRLGRTLRNTEQARPRPGRLRAELLALVRLVEGSPTPSRRCIGRASAGITGGRGREGRRWPGDCASWRQVDAVLALHRPLRRPTAAGTPRRYGDLETGYIVTPTLPRTSCRPARAADRAPVALDISAAVRNYAEAGPLRQATDGTSTEPEAGINYLTVTGRAKSVASFATAAHGGRAAGVHRPAARDHRPGGAWVIAPRCTATCRRSPNLLADQAGCSTTATWARRPQARAASATPAATCSSTWRMDRPAQIRSAPLLQHAWAEFEHDIATRAPSPDAASPTATAASPWRGPAGAADQEILRSANGSSGA